MGMEGRWDDSVAIVTLAGVTGLARSHPGSPVPRGPCAQVRT